MSEAPHPDPIVLLVEDHVLLRKMLAHTLRDAGFRVAEAGNGADALALVQQGLRPRILVSDVRMPGPLNGLDLARRVRDMLPGIPVLLTTGYNELATHEFKVLLKPFPPDELLNCITELLGQRATPLAR